VPPPDRTRSDTFADRARREAERFRLATDSEFWACFCFRTPAAATAFTRTAGSSGRLIPGAALPQAPARPDPRTRAIRMLAARSTRDRDPAVLLTARPAADPLAGITDTGDLEHDSAAELTALLTALTAKPDPSPASILDSPHWAVAWWPHRQAKDYWLAATGIDVLGDKYLDGHRAAVILAIPLPEGK
jgi:hypothetical protein